MTILKALISLTTLSVNDFSNWTIKQMAAKTAKHRNEQINSKSGKKAASERLLLPYKMTLWKRGSQQNGVQPTSKKKTVKSPIMTA